MDILTLVQTPVNTLFVLAGLVIVFFAFFDVSKGTIRSKRTPAKNSMKPITVGAILILMGLFYKPDADFLAEPTPSPEIPTEIASIFQHANATPVSTDTKSPIITPETPTLTSTSIPIKTINDGCIDSQTWQAISIDTNALGLINKQNNCWNINNLGFFAGTDGTLHVIVEPSKVNSISGIYTKVNENSIIEYNVYVNDFYIVYDDIYDKPGYISFSIASENNPMASKGNGRFKLQITKGGGSPLILFMLADTSESNGTELGTEHYLYGRTYNVRMELKGIFMEIFINNHKLNQTVTIPSGPKVFYIGYNIPLLGSTNVEIKDITLDGVRQ